MKNKIDTIDFWYHRIDLGDDVFTHGHHPMDPTAYRIPDDLTGKRVLDVGPWDGYWSFEALKRGAAEVVAIDNWSDMEWLTKHKRTPWDSFDICKEALGYGDECKRITMDVYKVAELGQFDVIFFLGALYHCRYPLLALDHLSKVNTGEIYIESAICDDYSPYRGDHIGSGFDGERDVVMEFYPTDQLGKVGSNWWSPTLTCLQLMVEAAGWEAEGWKIINPDAVCACRGFCKGVKK